MAYIYQRGRVWYLGYQDETGKWKQRSLQTTRKSEAIDLTAELTKNERERRLGIGNGRTNRVALADLIARFLSERASLKPKTLEMYRYAFCMLPRILGLPFKPTVALDAPAVVPRLQKALDQATVEDLRLEVVMDWRNVRAQVTSPRTANIAVGRIKQLLQWAADAGLIRDNPLKGLRQLKESKSSRRALSAEEIRKLLDASPRHLRLVWWAFVTTGMRRGELIALNWKNLGLPKRVAYVGASKTGEGRAVPLREDLAIELGAWRSERKAKDEDPVFINSAGKRWRGDVLLHRLETCAKKAELNRHGLCLHTLRHTAVSHLLDAGASVGMVMDIVGHKTPEMTLSVYRHRLTTGHSAVEALDFLADDLQPTKRDALKRGVG